MIAARRLPRNFADGFIPEAGEHLGEPWMRHADQALEEDALLLIIQQELAKRCQKSQTRGRQATPAEVVRRMLLLKPRARWELRNAVAGSARPPGLSRVPPDGWRKGSGGSDEGEPGAATGAGGGRKTARAGGGDGPGKQDRHRW